MTITYPSLFGRAGIHVSQIDLAVSHSLTQSPWMEVPAGQVIWHSNQELCKQDKASRNYLIDCVRSIAGIMFQYNDAIVVSLLQSNPHGCYNVAVEEPSLH